MSDPHTESTPNGLTVVTHDTGAETDAGGETGAEESPEPVVSEPGKLMRIGVMLRELQEEVRRAEVDDAGRERLRTVHERAVEGLRSVVSGELRDELDELSLPLPTDHVPSESEIRLAQAQLIGWLEGLFQGIQAAIVSQQQAARQQLEQMRQQRGLPSGRTTGEHGAGQYL